jgi:hypothetical protein
MMSSNASKFQQTNIFLQLLIYMYLHKHEPLGLPQDMYYLIFTQNEYRTELWYRYTGWAHIDILIINGEQPLDDETFIKKIIRYFDNQKYNLFYRWKNSPITKQNNRCSITKRIFGYRAVCIYGINGRNCLYVWYFSVSYGLTLIIIIIWNFKNSFIKKQSPIAN